MCRVLSKSVNMYLIRLGLESCCNKLETNPIKGTCMKKLHFFLLMIILCPTACAMPTTSKNLTALESATYYSMPLCPDSDRDVVEITNDLPVTQLPCLGHDKYVNLAGLDMDKPLVVSLWASWCVICEDDVPAFIAAKNKFKNLNLIGINYQDKESAAIASAAKWQLPFASLVDADTSLQSFYQISGLPVTLIYNEKGKLLARINGPIGTPEEFLNYLNAVLN